MKIYLIIITFVLLFLTTNSMLFAQEKSQSKFNVYLTYKHSFGLRERNLLWDTKDDLYNNAFFTKGTYSVSRFFAFGAGLGVDKHPYYTNFPLFASVHFTPFKNKKLLFYYDMGYSLGNKNSFPGLCYELGAGYKYMFKKNLGFLFSLGLNEKNMDYRLTINDDGTNIKLSTNRKSFSAGFGIVF